jgi:hypothetical protein
MYPLFIICIKNGGFHNLLCGVRAQRLITTFTRARQLSPSSILARGSDMVRNKLRGFTVWGCELPVQHPSWRTTPVGCPRLLVQYIRRYPPHQEADSICNLRTYHAVVTGDSLNMVVSTWKKKNYICWDRAVMAPETKFWASRIVGNLGFDGCWVAAVQVTSNFL